MLIIIYLGFRVLIIIRAFTKSFISKLGELALSLAGGLGLLGLIYIYLSPSKL